MNLYSIGTWDINKQSYTPQKGLSVPSFNITKSQLRQALRDLRILGYSANRDDWSILVERTNGRNWKDIRRGWKRK